MPKFEDKAPGIMKKLMADFAISVDDAAAITGNLGYESAGFEKLQEIKPTVPGSRGGTGFAQWTGPRRRAFEAWCERQGLSPASDEANYGYLWAELKGLEGTEGGTIPKVKATKGLEAKVVAFENAFLRAGIKNYDNRQAWARRALKAYQDAAKPVPLPTPPRGFPVPEQPPAPTRPTPTPTPPGFPEPKPAPPAPWWEGIWKAITGWMR